MMIADIAVLRSTLDITAESVVRNPDGSTIATVITARITRKSGANACISMAAVHCPLTSSVIAVVNPHPGQMISKAWLIGHCQPWSPMMTSRIVRFDYFSDKYLQV